MSLSVRHKAALLEHVPTLSSSTAWVVGGRGSARPRLDRRQDLDGHVRHPAPRPRARRRPVSGSRRRATPSSAGWPRAGRLALGYLGDPPATAARTPWSTAGGYAVSGDRAHQLADDTIELHGRDSVTINSGGEKIFAEEVEVAVKAHPDVVDCVVAGRPSPALGQRGGRHRPAGDRDHRRRRRRRRCCARRSSTTPLRASPGSSCRRRSSSSTRSSGRRPARPTTLGTGRRGVVGRGSGRHGRASASEPGGVGVRAQPPATRRRRDRPQPPRRWRRRRAGTARPSRRATTRCARCAPCSTRSLPGTTWSTGS